MKFDSIKSRLMLITGICVLGMMFLMVNQFHYTQQVLSLHAQKDSLREMNVELLQLRRHEKDFLLRHDMTYVDRFDTTYSDLNQRVDDIHISLSSLQDSHTVITAVQLALAAYADVFHQVVRLQQQIGLQQNSGLLAKQVDTYNAIQRELRQIGNAELGLMMADLRITEQTLLLQPSNAIVEEQASQYAALLQRASRLSATQNERLQPLLEQYQRNVSELIIALQQMGFTHQQGLRGEFRQQAHEVENRIASVIRDLVPKIEIQEQEVQRNTLIIMLITGVALVALLIKSFATFHNAFANFVMFFHRCKREYQRLDERKLGFAEFKSLACLANEMVEAKKETERQMRKIQQQLDELQAEQSAGNRI